MRTEKYTDLVDRFMCEVMGFDRGTWRKHQLWAADALAFGREIADWFAAVRT